MSIRIIKRKTGEYRVIKSNPKAMQTLKDLASHKRYLNAHRHALMPYPTSRTSITALYKDLTHINASILLINRINRISKCGLVKKQVNVRLNASKKRTRKNIQEVLHNNLDNKTYLLTLTYKDDIRDYDLAYKIFNDYVSNNVKGLKYMCVKELQNLNRGGVIHYHLIVFDVGFRIKERFNKWFVNIGGVHIQKVKDKNVNRLTNYFIGYIFKDNKNQMIETGKRIFTTSRNLNKSENVPYMYYRYLVDKTKGVVSFKELDKKIDVDNDIIDYAKWITKKVNIED